MRSIQKELIDKNFIHNEWIEGQSEDELVVHEKFSSEKLGSLKKLSRDQIEEVILSSVSGFNALKEISSGKRSEMLTGLSRALANKKEIFAKIISLEAGKPISYARTEVDRAVYTLNYAANEILRFSGEVINLDLGAGEGKNGFTSRSPIGPILGISPFNFPLNLAIHKIAPALAVGCSIVIKPSPFTPFSLLKFADLVLKAGFPPGALNVVIAEIDESELLVRDERLKMLSFTGSPKVGWHLKNICGKKKVILELGGNAPVLIDETGDYEKAASDIASGAFLYAGQICISTQRIFVDGTIYESFIQSLIGKMNQLVVGDPANDKTTVGPIISEDHLRRINSWVEEAVLEGATILSGGHILSKKNTLYSPTLLTNTKAEMKVSCEEVFGPVAVVEKITAFHEGIKMVNDSKFGLQMGLYTKNIENMKLAHKVCEYACVLINNIPGFRIDHMPYGGIKESGFGREGLKYAMEEMTEPKLLIF